MQLGLIPSVFLFFGVLSILYAAALHYFLKIKDQQAVRHWSLGSFIWGCSILLTIFRQDIPLLLSYFMANGLAFVAYVEMNRALKALLPNESKRPLRRQHDFWIFGAYTSALLAVARWMPPEFSGLASTCFVSTLVLLTSLQGARYCMQIAKAHHLKIARNFGYLYIAVALLWLARMLAAAAFQTVSAFDPAPVNTFVWLALFLTGVIRYMIFPMMLLQKTENDKQAQLRNTLIRANKTVASSALSASLAHELNQPLASIRINGQVLRNILDKKSVNQFSADDAELRAIIKDILSDNDRAAKIIISLRSIFTQRPAPGIPVDSAAVVRKSVEMFLKDLQSQRISLDLRLANDLWISLPEDELHQVVLNLLSNSMESLSDVRGPSKKRIAIVSRRRAEQFEITIEDNGSGIPPEIESVLFEILSTTKESGMGVGLWLCKYIVERHGGGISFSPVEQGGARFTITLPLGKNGAPQTQAQA